MPKMEAVLVIHIVGHHAFLDDRREQAVIIKQTLGNLV